VTAIRIMWLTLTCNLLLRNNIQRHMYLHIKPVLSRKPVYGFSCCCSTTSTYAAPDSMSLHKNETSSETKQHNNQSTRLLDILLSKITITCPFAFIFVSIIQNQSSHRYFNNVIDERRRIHYDF